MFETVKTGKVVLYKRSQETLERSLFQVRSDRQVALTEDELSVMMKPVLHVKFTVCPTAELALFTTAYATDGSSSQCSKPHK